MDEHPKLRRRFSLKAALCTMLAISVGLGLLRVNAVLAVLYFILALGGLVAYAIGRDLKEGVFWAMMVLIGLGWASGLFGGGL